MIDKIINLGKELEQNWNRQIFPHEAKDKLLTFSNSLPLAEFENEVMSLLAKGDLPKQLNLYNNFGEPSLTLFNNGKIAVDIYFWRKNDTLIHSHGFRGAFKVLYGESLHEEFEVETVESYGDDIKKTKLTNAQAKIMKPGDVQVISPELTHRVVHIGEPTVTLCLRTVEDTELNQWHHFSSGLSFKKSNLSETIVKQILYYQYLLKSDDIKAKQFVNDLLVKLDASSQISLYESLCYNEFGLEGSALDQIEEIFENHLQSQKWIELYKTHYSNLSMDLQEFKAGNLPVKLLAHCINGDYSKCKVTSLLNQVSNASLDEVYKELINDQELFSPEFKADQLAKVNSFFKALQ